MDTQHEGGGNRPLLTFNDACKRCNGTGAALNLYGELDACQICTQLAEADYEYSMPVDSREGSK